MGRYQEGNGYATVAARAPATQQPRPSQLQVAAAQAGEQAASPPQANLARPPTPASRMEGMRYCRIKVAEVLFARGAEGEHRCQAKPDSAGIAQPARSTCCCTRSPPPPPGIHRLSKEETKRTTA